MLNHLKGNPNRAYMCTALVVLVRLYMYMYMENPNRPYMCRADCIHAARLNVHCNLLIRPFSIQPDTTFLPMGPTEGEQA